jgi:hypothetical protein
LDEEVFEVAEVLWGDVKGDETQGKTSGCGCVLFPRVLRYAIPMDTALRYSHSMVAGGLEEMS